MKLPTIKELLEAPPGDPTVNRMNNVADSMGGIYRGTVKADGNKGEMIGNRWGFRTPVDAEKFAKDLQDPRWTSKYQITKVIVDDTDVIIF